MGLKYESSAPEFSLKDKNDVVNKLKDVKSEYVVVYFYPKDNTPGCTIEAIDFSKNMHNFKKIKTTVIGISGGNNKTKAQFCSKHNLRLILLSDPDFKVARKYKSYGQKSFIGRKYTGIFRNTFVLDKNHKIIKIFEKVNPIGHAEKVIEFIKSKK